MPHFEDDEPIKTHAANKAYRDNWDRMFGEEPRVAAGENTVETDPSVQPGDFEVRGFVGKSMVSDVDAIEMRLKAWGYRCNTCDKIVYDPENHQYHAAVKLGDK